VSLDEHYLLSEPLPPRMGNADQTIAAEEVVSGVSVVIHLLAGGNCPTNQEQLNIARGLPPAGVRYLREIGEHRGTPYVVTEPLPGNASFRSWLGQVAGRPMPVPEFKTLVASEPDVSRFKKQVWKVPAVPPSLDQAKPGEFTQMFKTVETPSSPVPPAPPPPSAPPAPDAPGEFTAMFQAQPISKPQPPPSSPAPSPPAPPSPGEFTRLMQAQNPAKPQPPSAPPATPTAPPPSAGEFTQMFQAASMGTGVRPAPPAPPESAKEPADVARTLDLKTITPPTPAPPPQPTSDYDKTRLFTAPTPPPPLDFGAEPTAGPRPARSDSPLTSAQPGEFTRMLQSPLAPSPQAPLFSAAAEPISEKTPGGFTQLFESPFAAPKPAHVPPTSSPQTFSPKPAAPDQNEFDRLFNEPKAPPVRGNVTNVYAAPQATPQPAPAQQGPSEYTLMFKGSAAAPAAPAPTPKAATPVAPPAAKPAAPYMTLIYVLGGLLVVAIVLVVYLLLKK
jgi:hypothetical protein